MQNQLQKAINLAKKTGDRLIVFNSAQPEDIYVVMALRDYENLTLGKSEVRGLTEDELLDKINRDIAIWKSEQDLNVSSIYNQQIYEDDSERSDLAPDYGTRVKNIMENRFKKDKKFIPGWSIPNERKQHAEEVIEEDRQYLEEVPY